MWQPKAAGETEPGGCLQLLPINFSMHRNTDYYTSFSWCCLSLQVARREVELGLGVSRLASQDFCR